MPSRIFLGVLRSKWLECLPDFSRGTRFFFLKSMSFHQGGMGFGEFLQVFDGVSTGCGEAASSKTRFCWLKPVVLAETI